MPSLQTLLDYCDERLSRATISDFPGAHNGLQVGKTGAVRHVGAAVDASLPAFRKAAELGVDFLIVHHGLFWSSPEPWTGVAYEKMRCLLEADCAVYGAHLPLDAHPEIGNNACIARLLELEVEDWFLEHEGTPIAAVAKAPLPRAELASRLKALYPGSYRAIECGRESLERVAILSGSGRSAIEPMQKLGIDTLITGELRQEHFVMAQDQGLNLYPCGHYATEIHGVQALAEEIAARFELPCSLIRFDCPI